MNCPECDAKLNIPEDAAVGEIVSCADCGADYEISKKEGYIMPLQFPTKFTNLPVPVCCPRIPPYLPIYPLRDVATVGLAR